MPRSRILLRRGRGPDVDGRADGREGEPPPLEPHRGDAGQCGRHRVPILPDHARRRREDEGPRGHPAIRYRGTPRTVALVDAAATTSPAEKGFSIAGAREVRGGRPMLFASYTDVGPRRPCGPRGLVPGP